MRAWMKTPVMSAVVVGCVAWWRVVRRHDGGVRHVEQTWAATAVMTQQCSLVAAEKARLFTSILTV